MAGGSESRCSMASASVAAHRAEANVADARLARYNDRIGRVRKERAVWPGAAFIVEALLLLVFLTGSLAVLMNLNAEADRIGRESADLMDGLVLATRQRTAPTSCLPSARFTPRTPKPGRCTT